jgi:hypothetical protein
MRNSGIIITKGSISNIALIKFIKLSPKSINGITQITPKSQSPKLNFKAFFNLPGNIILIYNEV